MQELPKPASLACRRTSERLLVPKTKISKCNGRCRDHEKGTMNGSITIIGLGPGSLDLLPPSASQSLENADVIVGYQKLPQTN